MTVIRHINDAYHFIKGFFGGILPYYPIVYKKHTGIHKMFKKQKVMRGLFNTSGHNITVPTPEEVYPI